MIAENTVEIHRPRPDDIAEARASAGLTQAQAAILCCAAPRTWQHWEYGDRRMPVALWELFLLKSGQHPEFQVISR